MTRLVEIHLPVAAGVTREQLSPVLTAHNVLEATVTRGRLTHLLQLQVPDDLGPEAEGQLRADVAGVVELATGDQLLDLQRRVGQLERQLQARG